MSALERGRAFAVSRMTETVLIGRFTVGTDPVSLDPVRVLVDERYSGVGRVKYPTMTVSRVMGAGQVVVSQDITLSVPSDAPVLQIGDEVLVVGSGADSSLVGLVFRVKGSAQAGQTTAHRYPVVEVSGG